MKRQTFLANNAEFGVTLESVLGGHEGWVYGLHWHPGSAMKLLSASLDKTMIIWEPEERSGVWSETLRVGEVGGNSLGFYGCKFRNDGEGVLAYSYHGSFHMWEHEKEGHWVPKPTMSGHFGEAMDLSWDPLGR